MRRTSSAFLFRTSATGTLLVIAFVGLGEPAQAQQEELISDRCDDRVELQIDRKLRIGGPEDPGRVGSTLVFARDARGQLLFFNPTIQGQVHVFDSLGQYVESFGREGEGPGEYRGLIRDIVVTAGDTVHIFDSGNLRHTKLGPAFEVVATRHIPASPSLGGMLRLSSGAWITNAVITDAGQVGHPLHLIGNDGEIVRSFGALTPVYRSDARRPMERSLAAAGEDRVWAAHRSEYRLELWDTANRLHRTLVRDVPWFRPWVRVEATNLDEPWPAHLWDLHLDGEGLLWVTISVPGSDWREHVEEHAPGQFWFPNTARYFSTIVEVVDAEQACVVARLETDVYLRRAVSDGLFMAYEQDSSGVPYLELWEVEVPQPFSRSGSR